MRIVKQGFVRKQEFLDAALSLFLDKGYDDTTVNDILHAVGVSKGGFYHYFDSKADVLKAITAQLAQPVVDLAARAASAPGLDALQKLNMLIESSYRFRSERAAAHGASRTDKRDENNQAHAASLRAMSDEVVIRLAAPAITHIIEQGVAEGRFHTSDPGETATLFIRLSSVFRERLTSELATHLPQDAQKTAMQVAFFYQDVMERLLGAPAGSIRLSDAIVAYAGYLAATEMQEQGAIS